MTHRNVHAFLSQKAGFTSNSDYCLLLGTATQTDTLQNYMYSGNLTKISFQILVFPDVTKFSFYILVKINTI